MPSAKIQTPEGLTLELELAGAGSRFAAGMVDLLIIGLVGGLLGVAAALLAQLDPTGLSAFARGFLAFGTLLIVVIFWILAPLFSAGRSPGKALFGLRILSEEGGAATPIALSLRAFVWIVDALPVPLPLGILAISVGGRRQRLGDLVAGTLVVRESRPAPSVEPWPDLRWETLEERQLSLGAREAALLASADLRLLVDLITRRGLAPRARARLIQRTARHYRQLFGLPESVGDHALVRELYLFARERVGLNPCDGAGAP